MLPNTPVAIVGIDFGARRVGIAVSTSGILASPHTVIRNDGDLEQLAGRIVAIGIELEAERFVLGIPETTRKSAEAAHEKIRRLAVMIEERSGLAVTLWNEAFTTTEAASMRRERGKNWRKTREEIDKEAAAVILQSYLDSKQGGAP